MSREIKFRCWNNCLREYIPEKELLEMFCEYINEDHLYIEQYTGLKDKNGKKIYEGDLVKFDCGDETPAEVIYQDGSYFIKALDDGTLFYDPDADKPCPLGWLETYGLEVIGNIHENPELLGGEE